jgi:hypothetical protein
MFKKLIKMKDCSLMVKLSDRLQTYLMRLLRQKSLEKLL